MVRYVLLIALILSLVSPAFSQSVGIGMRISSGLGSTMATSGARDYYILDSERYHIRTSGTGYQKLNAFMPPEVFVRYQSKNRLFLQAGTSFIAARVLTYYGLDPEVEDRYNPDAMPQEGIVGGMIPRHHLATRSFYFTPYINANYFLCTTTAIKPFISLGVSPTFLHAFDYMSFGYENDVILGDIAKRSESYINGRASVGVQFYDLHLEFHALSNITEISSSPNPYEARITSFYLSLGYTFLNFNLIKKSRS